MLSQINGRLTEAEEAQHLKAMRHLPVVSSAVLGPKLLIIAWSDEFSRKENALS